MSETMKDMAAALEESYKMMGDGAHDTDQLLAWKKASELLESGEIVTVNVLTSVKGGVIANFEGLRAFIPASGLSLKKVDSLDQFIGQDIQVQVVTADMDADKLVLSAKELLKKAQKAEQDKKLAAVTTGAVLKGKVESLQDYGAFVRLENDLSGLVHISQISNDRIKHPSVVLSVGQEVDVKVIDIKNGKISLSMKALLEPAEEEEPEVEIPVAEEIGTSMADLLKNFKL